MAVIGEALEALIGRALEALWPSPALGGRF
jgi:hypothetical protein